MIENKNFGSRPKIGLALGSGGARGLVHIGVIKVLRENNIPIDFIAGVSAGAIVGAYYSLNEEVNSLEKEIRKLTKKDFLKFIDITSPNKALVSGNKAKEYFRKLINDKSFSDVKIPLVIVATDMGKGEEVHLSSGKIIDAIRASMSIPGIFPPAEINGRFFLDGGIVNPTPVDVVKRMGADIVVGVDLTIRQHIEIKNPNIVDTLMRAFEIIRTKTTNHKIGEDCPNTIIIQMGDRKYLDSYKFYNTLFIEKGEELAKKALPRIKSAIDSWERKN